MEMKSMLEVINVYNIKVMLKDKIIHSGKEDMHTVISDLMEEYKDNAYVLDILEDYIDECGWDFIKPIRD